MPDLWYPDGIRDPAPESTWGTHADSGEPKFVLHTTEGSLGAYVPDPSTGAGRRYYGNTGTWPNYTLALQAMPARWRVFNHIPAGRSSLSLRNRPGGVQTNRDNASQVEIAARAADIATLPGEALDELARLLAWEHATRGVPLLSRVMWIAYPASYGEGARQRLSPATWDAYAGVLGHQHVPENDHGDPGEFPIHDLLTRAKAFTREGGGPPPGPAPDPVRPGNRFRDFPVVREGGQDDPGRVVEARRDPRLVDASLPVLTLQIWLGLVMQSALHADGVYGPLTRDAVMHFQRWWRGQGLDIDVDGVCGPQTWSQLDAVADVQGR